MDESIIIMTVKTEVTTKKEKQKTMEEIYGNMRSLNEYKEAVDYDYGRCGTGWRIEDVKTSITNTPDGSNSAVVTVNVRYFKKGTWSNPVPGVGYDESGNARLAYLDAIRTALMLVFGEDELRQPPTSAEMEYLNSIQDDEDDYDEPDDVPVDDDAEAKDTVLLADLISGKVSRSYSADSDQTDGNADKGKKRKPR